MTLSCTWHQLNLFTAAKAKIWRGLYDKWQILQFGYVFEVYKKQKAGAVIHRLYYNYDRDTAFS